MNTEQKLRKIIEFAKDSGMETADFENLLNYPIDIKTIFNHLKTIKEKWDDKTVDAIANGYEDIYEYMEDPAAEIILKSFSNVKLDFEPIYDYPDLNELLIDLFMFYRML